MMAESASWSRPRPAGGTSTVTTALAALAFGRATAASALPLTPALAGERRTVTGRAGPLSYYVAGAGPPVLLVHSVNAAASAYEVRPLYEALAAERRVYALDLPGFGFSDRSERPYRVRLYVDAMHDMLDAIAADSGGGAIDAIALSLSSEFLARAATERPDAVRTLALITPTGFDRRSAARRGEPGQDREVKGLHGALNAPLWSRGLFDLLVARRSIRFFLEKTWGSKDIDEGLLDYDYLTAHQPGARHAPYAFVSGRLFSADIRAVYERLAGPVLVMHGTRGDFQDFSGIAWTRARPNWRVKAFDAGALVHFERLEAVMKAYRAFRDAPPGSSGSGVVAAHTSSSPSSSPSP